MNSLYQRLGGKDAVNAVVDTFYAKVLSDDRINYFFNNIDMAKQKLKQKAFLSMVFGGPASYTGKNMSDGHRHLLEKGLNDAHVDAVIELLALSLKEHGVSDKDIEEVAAIANSVRDDVLCRRKSQ